MIIPPPSAALKKVPIPSADMERVAAYVQAMTKPVISGVGAGETLTVAWAAGGSSPRRGTARRLVHHGCFPPTRRVRRRKLPRSSGRR